MCVPLRIWIRRSDLASFKVPAGFKNKAVAARASPSSGRLSHSYDEEAGSEPSRTLRVVIVRGYASTVEQEVICLTAASALQYDGLRTLN